MTGLNQITQIAPSTAMAKAATSKGSESLGQKDFLTLLTAQLKNQDPLKPLENTEFLGQMAQFSTVAGIDRLNETLGGQGAGLREARMAMATGMLGHSVLVQTPLARADAEGAVRGAVDLTEPAQALIVTYADAASGALLHSQTLGAQVPGRQVRGKTGTTNDNRDAWFAGWMDGLTAVVWMGNDDYTATEDAVGGAGPARVFSAFMSTAPVPPRGLDALLADTPRADDPIANLLSPQDVPPATEANDGSVPETPPQDADSDPIADLLGRIGGAQ